MPNLTKAKTAELRKLAKKAKIPNWETLEREDLLEALKPKKKKEVKDKKIEKKVKETSKPKVDDEDDEIEDDEGSEDEELALEDMSIGELKEVAKEEGVDIKGLRKKKDIIKAIEGIEDEGDEEDENDEEIEKVEDGVVAPGVEEVRFQIGGKAERMKAKLAKQRKIRVIVQLMDGEKRGSTMSVILNGYRLNIQKGVYVDVPRQIADIIMESQQQTVLASEHELLLKDKKPELDV